MCISAHISSSSVCSEYSLHIAIMIINWSHYFLLSSFLLQMRKRGNTGVSCYTLTNRSAVLVLKIEQSSLHNLFLILQLSSAHELHNTTIMQHTCMYHHSLTKGLSGRPSLVLFCSRVAIILDTTAFKRDSASAILTLGLEGFA